MIKNRNDTRMTLLYIIAAILQRQNLQYIEAYTYDYLISKRVCVFENNLQIYFW